MAFSDLIDMPNVDQCLLAVIQPKTVTGGTGSKLYMSERYITCATFVPGDSGSPRFAGVVDSWGEFGYVAEAMPTLVISDGSVLCRNDRPFGPYGTFAELLTDYELHGASIWIGQALKQGNSISTALIFSGVISEVGGITKKTVELQFTDHSATTPIIPFSEITRVDFAHAPDSSIGKSIPIIMGDFSEGASPYSGTDPEDLQEVGCGNLNGVPIVITDKNLDTYNEGPDYRISDHLIKELDADAGAMLLEPGEELPGRIHPDDWALVNSTFAGLETDWPMRVRLPVRPDGRGTLYMSDSNPMLACDGDLSTVSIIDPDPGYTGYLELVPRNVSQLGKIQKVEVCCWVKAGGNGHLYLGMLTSGGSWYGTTPYTDFTLSGSEEILKHEVLLTNDWPEDRWNFDDYRLRIHLPASTYYAEIRELWLLVTYVPNRTPTPPKPESNPNRHLWAGGGKSWGGGFGKGGGNRTPVDKDRWWPTHNPKVLAYAKGIKDDASGTYTGTANALIENGADMGRYLVANYLGLSSGQIETGTAIGNFSSARAELGTYHKLATAVGDKMGAGSQYELLCQECRAMPVWNSAGKLGMVVIDPTPAVNYRSAVAPFDFIPDEHFYANTFKCWRTPTGQLASSVFIEFDYCHATGKFRKTAFITPDGTDNGFGTDDDSARKTLAGYAEDRFGTGREFRLKAYDVRNQGVAKALRNFYFDNLWRPRVWFEFQCGVHVCDMSAGNVMRFGVERINGMKVPTPDVTDENWDDYLWYVAGAIRLEQEGDVSRYQVRGFEAIEPTTASDWVAAADDT